MKRFKLIGVALALAAPTAAFAAEGCCKESCCKDMKDMKDMKAGDHAGHAMPDAPKK